ncbi:MAG TPA: PQQ-dependent sugar dehydrogenase [Rectinemataceae bacterium]|nr:PQQ-dependent sugar dehydrogenase [Rectinemataceae bacterium]
MSTARAIFRVVRCAVIGLCAVLLSAPPLPAQVSGGGQDAVSGTSGVGMPLPFPIRVPEGFAVHLLSDKVPGARFIAVAPNGDILISLIGAGRIVAVHPGADPGAEPEIVISGLEKPNALAFRGNDLYVATWTGVIELADYPHGRAAKVLFSDMPRNGDHNARALALGPDGSIYISSGSDCNVCRERDPRLATVLRYGADGGQGVIVASGLRNASGLAFDAQGKLWAVVNQRDNLTPEHRDLPPDELDAIVEGGDYGWPTAYPDLDGRRRPNPEFPESSTTGFRPSDFPLQAHSAPLQIAFYEADAFPPSYRGALFIAFHGSWNRDPPTGYKVVVVRFRDGRPVSIEDFATGWRAEGRVLGRPVGLAVSASGELYVSDDRGYLFGVTYRD